MGSGGGSSYCGGFGCWGCWERQQGFCWAPRAFGALFLVVVPGCDGRCFNKDTYVSASVFALGKSGLGFHWVADEKQGVWPAVGNVVWVLKRALPEEQWAL